MKKANRIPSISAHLVDQTAAAIEIMQHYCEAHPGSPAAVRSPRLFIRSGVWVALLGPSVEEGIIGIGATVEAALRAFDQQYLAGLHPPAEWSSRRRFRSGRKGSSYPHVQA